MAVSLPYNGIMIMSSEPNLPSKPGKQTSLASALIVSSFFPTVLTEEAMVPVLVKVRYLSRKAREYDLVNESPIQ